jgi:hypothetical protein
MDFTNFVFLLARKQLHFTRLDEFNDPFEGCWPKENARWFVEWVRATCRVGKPEELQRKLRMLDPQFASLMLRHTVFVNCWHLNDGESDAMWKLYAQGNKGVAVISRFGRLKAIMDRPCKEIIQFAKVVYIDHDKGFIDPSNPVSPCLCKHKSFEHERELRAYIWRAGEMIDMNMIGKVDMPKGLDVDVDLNELIEEIVIGPTVPEWTFKLTKKVLSDYGCAKPIKQSLLNCQPSWIAKNLDEAV